MSTDKDKLSYNAATMVIRFFNSLTRKVEEFKPLVAGEVTIYSCGPTVYNYVHIGNLRAFAFNDLLQRYLKYRGFKVKHVMNVTDFDDKTIRGSRQEGKSLKEFTEFYTEAFVADLKTLRIEIPPVMPRATDHIPGMVEMTKTLLDRGIAYRNEKGDVYFRISKCPDYGLLANIDLTQLRQNAGGRLARADEYSKDDANDFALWKAWDSDDGDVFWETELGKGRPGWHIECSVMSAAFLGQPFDIHTGGVDLIFPHHTNELAQSQCAHDKPLANMWIHNAHLIVNGKKMSKSEGNFFSVRDLMAKGYSAMAVRFELLKTHYRQQLDFREDQLNQTALSLDRFHDLFARLDESGKGKGGAEVDSMISSAHEAFTTAMDDDLNVSGGLGAVYAFAGSVNKVLADLNAKEVVKVRDALLRFDSVLGFVAPPLVDLPEEAMSLIADRAAARAGKDFAKSDLIRDQLLEKFGVVLKDGPSGTRWQKIR